MNEIPASRRIVETLLVRAMLEHESGNREAAADFAAAVLMMLDGDRDRELVVEARRVLLVSGVVGLGDDVTPPQSR